ncbi:hypothetical protein VTH06DRAFT_3532 [Thermothelomyces fergusii]
MSPPPSSTRSAHVDTYAPASRHASAAVSAALQGATLAFNKQKAAAAAAVTVAGSGKSNSDANGADGLPGLGPAPPRQPKQASGRAMPAGHGTGPNHRRNSGGEGSCCCRRRLPAQTPVDGQSPEAAGSAAHPSATEPDGCGPAHAGLVAQRLVELHAAGGPDTLAGKQPSPQSTSPSVIAATLAPGRSGSPIRGQIPQLDLNGGRATPGRTQSTSAASVSAGSLGSSVTPEKDLPDTSSIPPTTSLVSLFESKSKPGKDDVDPVKKRAPSTRTENGDGKSRAGGEETQQALGKSKAKPAPKPKPKPKLPAGDGKETGLDGNAHGSANGTSQGDKTAALGGGDGNKDRSGLRPPQSPPASQGAGHTPIMKPSASASSQRPETPSPSAPDRGSSDGTTPQTTKLLRTPRLEPPALPDRASGNNTIKGPAGPRTLGTSRNDQADTGPHDSPDLALKRQPSQGSASSKDTRDSGAAIRAAEAQPIPPSNMTSNTSTATNLTLGSLTNAIVASSLASARLTPTASSQLPPPVPAPRRSGRSPLRPHHTADGIRSQLTGGGNGSQSPNRRNAPPTPKQQQQQQQQSHKAGVLLQTLRSPHTSLSDDEDDRRRQLHHHRRRNKVLGGGNRKHAHHEGSRRRWRDEITPRERRRYEAVWASNRGLLLRPGWAVQYAAATEDGESPEPGSRSSNNSSSSILDQSRAPPGRPEAELVVNVVARDIWSRSRLPADELAEVWDLVDRDGRGALTRDEFVVGMWLIDQRLRGRKIPARVSPSVWDSVAGGAALGVVVPPPASKKAGPAGWKGW